MIKKIVLVASLILHITFLYEFFGNFIRAISSPYLCGKERNAHFAGYYMISAGYASLSLLLSFLSFVLFATLRKREKNGSKSS